MNPPRTVIIRKEVPIQLTVADLAAAFCELDDDSQARFFVECARIGRTFEQSANSPGRGDLWQWSAIGRHLATCTCATDGAREMVRIIAENAQRD